MLLYGDDDDFAKSEDGAVAPHADSSRPRAMDGGPATDPGGVSNGDPVAEEDAGAEDEEGRKSEPPSTERILKRALCMAAVAIRSRVEETGDVESFRAEFLPWLAREGLEEELESWERKSIYAAQGVLSEDDISEGLCLPACCHMLAWALGLTDLPRPDRRQKAVELLAPLGFETLSPPPIRVAELLEKAQRRSASEQTYANDLCLAIHWRFVQHQVRPEPLDFVEVGKNSWWHEFDPSGPWIVDGDLGFEGVPIHQLDPDDLPVAFMLARYRHKAMNWLAGDDPVFSMVSTDT